MMCARTSTSTEHGTRIVGYFLGYFCHADTPRLGGVSAWLQRDSQWQWRCCCNGYPPCC